MDTTVGLAAGLALAGALPYLPYACGLGTGALLAADLVAHPLRPSRGLLPVRRFSPDATALAEASQLVTAERWQWWEQRLERAWLAGAERTIGDGVSVE
jgi:O-succinylbenzoate synthase